MPTLICPQCGHGEMITRPSGDRVCGACGHAWTPKPQKQEMPRP